MQTVQTLIIGAGQAGLTVSYFLKQRAHDHVVLEKARIGEAWRRRWDSFRLVTPNWSVKLPGHACDAPPDGFMLRDQVVGELEAFARSFDAPVRCGVEVKSVTRSGGRYRVETSEGAFDAANVVVASGAFPIPRRPAFAERVPADVFQLHTEEYRNPSVLPPGAVLVVGSAQSGCQIAEELRRSGRDVILALGSCGWAPRRYRGRDLHEWLNDSGFLDQTVDMLPNPDRRFACNPHVIWKSDDMRSLRDFARLGVQLVGRVLDVVDGSVHLAEEVEESVARADKACRDIQKVMDDYIARAGVDAPPEPRPADEPKLPPGPSRIDLRERRVGTIVWATGFSYDYRWIREPVFDDKGYPVHTRGVTSSPGLYFVGLPWLHTRKSPLLLGTAADAAHVVEHIG